MTQLWSQKAALFGFLAQSFLYTNKDIAEVLTSGEYGNLLSDLMKANDLEQHFDQKVLADLEEYIDQDADQTLHRLREEYTRLFIGVPHFLITPYAGVWKAEKKEQTPLLFINPESLAIEKYMRNCGVRQLEGTNEPLDHIGTELEFMQYLCLCKANAVTLPEGIKISQLAYEDFYNEYFIDFAQEFASRTIVESKEKFFRTAAIALKALPARV